MVLSGAWTSKCSVQGCLPEIREFGRVRQTIWKMLNIGFHVGMPKLQVVKHAHFLNRLLWCPAVKSYAVRGNEHTGTISTQPAVNEYFPSGLFADEREESGDLVIGWCCPA